MNTETVLIIYALVAVPLGLYFAVLRPVLKRKPGDWEH